MFRQQEKTFSGIILICFDATFSDSELLRQRKNSSNRNFVTACHAIDMPPGGDLLISRPSRGGY